MIEVGFVLAIVELTTGIVESVTAAAAVGLEDVAGLKEDLR
jgi:hypothetical protein